MVLEVHVLLRVIESDFREKKLFAPKMGKMDQKWGFLNILENFVINFS